MLRRIDLDDGQFLAYRDTGGDGPVVLLLHGGVVDSGMWAPQLTDLPGYRVVAADARGHGASSTPVSPFRLVDDVVALLDALRIRQVVPVGVSMGGGTAVDLTVEHPERVRGLVVSGTGTSTPQFRDPWQLEVLGAWQRAAQDQDPEGWIEAFLRFLPGPHRTADQVDPRVTADIERMARHTLTTHVLPCIATGHPPVEPTRVSDSDTRRREITVPVLALSGALDSADHIRLARELVQIVPDGRQIEIPDTTHYPNLEAAAQFNRLLSQFLSRLPSRGGNGAVATRAAVTVEAWRHRTSSSSCAPRSVRVGCGCRG